MDQKNKRQKCTELVLMISIFMKHSAQIHCMWIQFTVIDSYFPKQQEKEAMISKLREAEKLKVSLFSFSFFIINFSSSLVV